MDEEWRPLPDVGLWNLVRWLFLLGLLWTTVAGRGLGMARCNEPVDCFEYNHTLTQILVEYASVVYVNDLDSLIAWNCSRCRGLTKEFRLVELIVDTQHCLQAYVGLAEDLNAIVIAFRGTQENSIQNWMEDLYFKQLDLKYPGVTGAMVHRGFYTAYHNTTLRTRIVEAVRSVRQEIDGVGIMVTGHSMGGAMAAFCALDLTVNYGMEDILTVTFGQPRVGNNIFASYYGALVPKTYRMTHAHDMVPHLPPYYSHFPQRTYHHFGREVWIYKIGLESLSYELERVCDSSGEDPTCSRSVAGNSITDHLCYLGVYLQADTWGSCTFLLESNVAEVTNDSLVIKLPLTSGRRQSKGEIKSWQSF